MGERQLDFICDSCPLRECNQDSLFCAFRWATKKNAAQREARTLYTSDRTQYFADRYQRQKQERKAKRGLGLDDPATATRAR